MERSGSTVNALWTDWMNADLLTGATIGALLGTFLAVFVNGVIVPWFFRRVTGEAKRQREERKAQARRRELLRALRERSAALEGNAESFPTTLELDEVLRRRKKLRTKDVTDTYELLRQLEAEERVRPVRPAAQKMPDFKEIRWRYVFFRESPSVPGGIEAKQLVHIKRQAKALEERMGALDELKREMDRIGETLERIEKRIQPEELRRLLDEVNEKLNRTDARDSFSPEAGAENSAPGSGQVG